MKNQKGFALLTVLLVILGIVVVGGGAYYVMHQQSHVPTLSDAGMDDSQTLPTKTTQPQQVQATTNKPPSVTIDQSSLLTSSSNPTITGTISGTVNFSIQVGGSQGLSTERGGITISNGHWSAGPFDLSPGTYPVYIIDNNSGKSLTSATLTVKANSNTVPGMSQYTDANFGFSFWYPSSWTITTENQISYNFPGGTIKKMLVIQDTTNAENDFYLFEVNAHPSITIVGHLSSPTYYFDATAHTWMTYDSKNNTNPIAANVSTNTMGGLHMLLTGAVFDPTVVPLSAINFIVVGDPQAGNGRTDPLTKTVTATDPSVATPVSAAQQTAIIQAEAAAYAGQ